MELGLTCRERGSSICRLSVSLDYYLIASRKIRAHRARGFSFIFTVISGKRSVRMPPEVWRFRSKHRGIRNGNSRGEILRTISVKKFGEKSSYSDSWFDSIGFSLSWTYSDYRGLTIMKISSIYRRKFMSINYSCLFSCSSLKLIIRLIFF